LRKKYKNQVLTFDGSAGHTAYKVLSLFKEKHYCYRFACAHKSQDSCIGLQCVLSFQEILSKYSKWSKSLEMSNIRKDVYSLCELVGEAYNGALKPQKIMSGFKSCGVWCDIKRSTVPQVINVRDITNFTSYGVQEDAHKDFRALVESFRETRNF